jgi:hypothetical protein
MTLVAGAAPALDRPPRFGLARATVRQHRRVLVFALATLGTAVVVLVATGTVIHAEPPALRPHFAEIDMGAGATLVYLHLLPIALGALVGAPLVGRDLGRGTARFAWTQGAGRIRWVTVKLIVAGLVLAGPAAVTGLVFAWWYAPYLAGADGASSGGYVLVSPGWLDNPGFGFYAPGLVGWTLAPFALAVLLGALFRTTTAATTVAATVFFAIVALINGFSLPDQIHSLLPPTRSAFASMPDGSTVLRLSLTHLDGRRLAGPAPEPVNGVIVRQNGSPLTSQWIAQHHLRLMAVYQPPSRFWAVQFIQGGGLLVLAVLLGAAAVWVVRRQSA